MNNILQHIYIACFIFMAFGGGLYAATDQDPLDAIISVPDARTVYKRLCNVGVENVSSIMPHLKSSVCQRRLSYREVCARVRRSTLRVSQCAFSVGCELHSKYNYIVSALVSDHIQEVCNDAWRK